MGILTVSKLSPFPILKCTNPLLTHSRCLTDIQYYKCVEWSHLHSWESQSARRKFLLKLQQLEKEKNAKALHLHTRRSIEHPSKLQPVNVPNYVERGPSEILRLLSSVVKRDHTAADYKFHDDPYLIPYNASSKRAYVLSKDGGRKAARFVLDNHAKLFEKNLIEAEPPIKNFMPKLKITEEKASLELLQSYISGYNVQSAVEVYEVLKRKKIHMDVATKQSLLELLAYHNESEEMPDNYQESAGMVENSKTPWLEGNMAEQIHQDITSDTNLTADEKASADLAIMRGMSKHKRGAQGWIFYEMTKDLKCLERFNTGILCVPVSKENFFEDWEPVKTILAEMASSGIKPDGITLRNVLAHINFIGSEERNFSDSCKLALSTLAEFKALGVTPSLASFGELIDIFTNSSKKCMILFEVIDEVKKIASQNGGSLLPTVIHPDDFKFFRKAMDKISNGSGKMRLAYKLHNIVSEHDDNQLLLGDFADQNNYYRSFMILMLKREPIDVSMEYISLVVPNIWSPGVRFYIDLIRQIKFHSGIQHLPKVWNDLQISEFCSARQDVRFEVSRQITNILGEVDLETLTGPENLKDSLLMLSTEIFESFSAPITERKYPLTSNIHAVPILCDLLKFSSRAGNSNLSKRIVKFCRDETTRLIGAVDSDALQEFFKASLAENDSSAAYDCTVYSAEQKLPNALSMGLELVKIFDLNEVERNQLNLLFSHEVLWTRV